MRLVGEIVGGWIALGTFCCVVWWRLRAVEREAGERDASDLPDLPVDLWFKRDFDE